MIPTSHAIAQDRVVLLKNTDQIIPLRPHLKLGLVGGFGGISGGEMLETALRQAGLNVARCVPGFDGGANDLRKVNAGLLAKRTDAIVLYLDFTRRRGRKPAFTQLDLLTFLSGVNPHIIVFLRGNAAGFDWANACDALLWLAPDATVKDVSDILTDAQRC